MQKPVKAVGIVGGHQQLQRSRSDLAVSLRPVGHRPEIHAAVADGPLMLTALIATLSKGSTNTGSPAAGVAGRAAQQGRW